MKVINKEIDLLCWFDKQGAATPIRFRLINEEGQDQVIKIEKILKKDLEKLAGNRMFVYTCQSLINNETRILTLKYELDTCRWFLFKI